MQAWFVCFIGTKSKVRRCCAIGAQTYDGMGNYFEIFAIPSKSAGMLQISEVCKTYVVSQMNSDKCVPYCRGFIVFGVV